MTMSLSSSNVLSIAEAQNHIYDSLGERFRLRIIPGPNSFIVLPKTVGRSIAVSNILNSHGVSAASMERSWPTSEMGDSSRCDYILAVSSDDSLMNRLKRLSNAETVYTGYRMSGGSKWKLEADRVCEALEAILDDST